MATKKVTTATLIRGQVYVLRHPDNTPQTPKDSLRFEKGTPVPVDEPKIVAILEDLFEETEDGDGEVFEKPLFRIDRNVSAPEDAKPRARRLAADREVKTRPRRRRAS